MCRRLAAEFFSQLTLMQQGHLSVQQFHKLVILLAELSGKNATFGCSQHCSFNVSSLIIFLLMFLHK